MIDWVLASGWADVALRLAGLGKEGQVLDGGVERAAQQPAKVPRMGFLTGATDVRITVSRYERGANSQ